LDRLGIAYAVGGSLASSARGIVRATFDVDLIAAISPFQAQRFAAELGPEWYADPNQIRESIVIGRAFNVIHIPLGNKVDIFPAKSEFHASQLQRATAVGLPFLQDSAQYPVATAEDTVLAKLEWYRLGGEVSERQWTDILGVLSTNPQLDLGYTRAWATRLGVGALLERALRERDMPV
jgi:hypothetical protein